MLVIFSYITFRFKKIESKEIKTNISEKFKLKNAKDAHIKLESGQTTGSLLLEP